MNDIENGDENTNLSLGGFVMPASYSLRKRSEKKGDLEVIPLEAALEKQKGLKVSDCFKKVRYVPLETTNNCLVGRGALAQILGDYIVVISEMNLCHLFDKQTGRFIRSVGRVGQGPGECQSLRGGWQNPHNKLFYFPG